MPEVARWPFCWPTTVRTGPMNRKMSRHETISRSTDPTSWPWGTDHHRTLRGLRCPLVTPARSTQQIGTQLPGHGQGEIAEPDGRTLGAGRGDLDLGQPEDAGRQGLEHVHALDPVQTHPLRLLPKQAAVDPKFAADAGGSGSRPR